MDLKMNRLRCLHFEKQEAGCQLNDRDIYNGNVQDCKKNRLTFTFKKGVILG